MNTRESLMNFMERLNLFKISKSERSSFIHWQHLSQHAGIVTVVSTCWSRNCCMNMLVLWLLYQHAGLVTVVSTCWSRDCWINMLVLWLLHRHAGLVTIVSTCWSRDWCISMLCLLSQHRAEGMVRWPGPWRIALSSLWICDAANKSKPPFSHYTRYS